MVDASKRNLLAILLSGWISLNILDLMVHCHLFQDLAKLPLIIIANVFLGFFVM